MKAYILANIGSLKALKEVILDCDDNAYQTISKPAFQSSLGQHARHIVEHYQCFFSQIKEGKSLNYDLRCRDPRLDSERKTCISEIDRLITEFTTFQTIDFDMLTSDDYSQYEARSSLCRELMFLVSHTEHHNAMIAAMKRLSGDKVDESFGVANATLNHIDRLKKASKKAVNQS